MLREGNALRDGNVQSLGELLNPSISLGLGFWVIAIEHYNNSLCFFLNAGPNSIVFDIA